MIGTVYRPYVSEESRLVFYEQDIYDLEKGKVIQNSDLFRGLFEIPFILVQLTEKDSSVDYFPKTFSSSDITTCWIKLSKLQLNDFLTKNYMEFNGINFSFLKNDY